LLQVEILRRHDLSPGKAFYSRVRRYNRNCVSNRVAKLRQKLCDRRSSKNQDSRFGQHRLQIDIQCATAMASHGVVHNSFFRIARGRADPHQFRPALSQRFQGFFYYDRLRAPAANPSPYFSVSLNDCLVSRLAGSGRLAAHNCRRNEWFALRNQLRRFVQKLLEHYVSILDRAMLTG
jgi:hypothetical protein